MRCMSACPALALTPLRRRTKTRFGPFKFGSGLWVARKNAGGRTPSENRAPVPIEVWSATKLTKPTAGKVAVPTITKRVGGMLKGASRSEEHTSELQSLRHL